MRWFIRLFVVLTVAWLVFMASPYYALYDFARAVEAGDTAAIKARVNFSAVRVSLSKQLVTAYLVATGRESELKSSNKSLVAAAGSTLVDPLLAQYVTPDALADFLAGRRGVEASPSPGASSGPTPSEAGAAETAPSAGAAVGSGFTLPGAGLADGGLTPKSLKAAWSLFLAAETRGFRAILFPVPPDKPPEEQFRLQFRLTGFTWRLVGVEMPQAIQKRLVQEMLRREGKGA
jgi:hypothetical protein